MGYVQEPPLNPTDYLNKLKIDQQSSLKSQAAAASAIETNTISSDLVDPQQSDTKGELVTYMVAFIDFTNKVGDLILEMSIKLRDAYGEISKLRRRNEELEAKNMEMNQKLTDVAKGTQNNGKRHGIAV